MENTEITPEQVVSPLSGVPNYLSINYSTGSSGGSFISTWKFNPIAGIAQYISNLGGQSFISYYTYTGTIALTVTNTTNKELTFKPGSVSSSISSIGGKIHEMRTGAGTIVDQIKLAAGATTGLVVYFRFTSTYTFPVIEYGYGTMRVNIGMSVTQENVTASYTIANVYDKYILAWK